MTALRALVQDEFAHSFERVAWRGLLDGDPSRPAGRGEPVYVEPVVGEVVVGAAREAMRNAATHGRAGRAERPLCLEIGLHAESGLPESLCLTIADDGVGIDAGRAQAAQTAGGTGGAGHGLALHSTLLAMVGGGLTVTSPPAGGTLVRIAVPRA